MKLFCMFVYRKPRQTVQYVYYICVPINNEGVFGIWHITLFTHLKLLIWSTHTVTVESRRNSVSCKKAVAEQCINKSA